MTRRILIGALAVTLGLGIGGAIGLAAHGDSGRRPSAHGATHVPRHVPGIVHRRPITPDTMLAWTFGPLPAGFADGVRRLPGVAHVVSVINGTVWLTRSNAPNGVVVDRPPPGFAIPLELAAANLPVYMKFLSPADRAFLPELERGGAVLGATSAKLRRVGAGGVLLFGSKRVPVAGVVPDAEIGAHELFVSQNEAAKLGVTEERYLLIDPKPGASQDRLAARIRALLPSGVPLRVRGTGETTFLRQGDAVLAPVILKQDFGEFAARPAPGGFLEVDPRWERAHIATVQVPILGTVRCNRAIIPQIRGALGDLRRAGLSQLIDPAQYAGCYVPKFLLNDPHAGLSHHSWGVALDVNVGQNPFGHTPHQDPRLVQAFERWGFIFGGRFLVPDGMHFEFVRFSSG
jgi:hypothetical protein